MSLVNSLGDHLRGPQVQSIDNISYSTLKSHPLPPEVPPGDTGKKALGSTGGLGQSWAVLLPGKEVTPQGE